MKILNIISAYSLHGGTISKLRTIVKDSRHEHQIFFYCYKNEVEEAKAYNDYYENIDVKTHYGDYGRNFIKAAFRIKRIIETEKIDIVHYYFNYENLTIMLLKTLCQKVRFIRSFVGYIPLSFFSKQLLKMALRRTENYVYISNYIKEKYEKDFPLIKNKNSTIIYNCPINVSEIDISIEKKDKIVYVGGLNKSKNVFILAKAMDLAVNKYNRKEVVLNIIGDGPDRRELEKFIDKNKLEKNIILHGYSKEVPKWLERCKIYVHPANNEGFGISIVEAMYMKCPCIVSNMSAPKEIVNKDCGFILPYDNPEIWAEKLIYLNDNKEIREEFGENAYKRAKEMFSREKFINAHDQMYEYIYKNGSLKKYNNQ